MSFGTDARTPPAVPSRRSAKANRKYICTNSETKPLRTRESAGFRNSAPALFLAASLPCPLDCIQAPIVHRRRRPRKPSAHGPHTLPHPFPTLVSRLRAAISLELSLRRHTIPSSFSSSLLARPRYRHRRDVVAEPLALPPALWDPGRGRRSAIVAGLGLTRRVAVHHETVRVGRDRLVERLEVDQVAQLDLHRGRSS